MKIYKFLIILFLGAVISSCQKNGIEYPVKYSSYSITDQKIKVYTSKGEITSSEVINKLVNRHQAKITSLEDENIKDQIIITYTSEDSAEVTISSIKEGKQRSVRKVNDVICLEKADTTYGGFGPLFKIEDVYSYHPVYYEEYFAPPGSGYSKYTKSKECYYLVRKGGKLLVPMFDFLWLFGTYEIQFYNNNNSFLESGMSSFFSSDTAIVQEYSIEMQ